MPALDIFSLLLVLMVLLLVILVVLTRAPHEVFVLVTRTELQLVGCGRAVECEIDLNSVVQIPMLVERVLGQPQLAV